MPDQNKLDMLCRAVFGHAYVPGKCAMCQHDVDTTLLRDEISKREYEISGMCQKCQDEAFGEDDEIPTLE